MILKFKGSANLGRWTGLALFSFMLLLQMWYWFKLDGSWIAVVRWTLVTFLFLQFWWAYILRKPLKRGAENKIEWLLPFFCAGLPFAIMLGPSLCFEPIYHRYPHWAEQFLWPLFRSLLGQEYWAGLWLMALGELITIWGMAYLRGNFSIVTEVREWVKTGPYRWVRHPLYAGEILSVWGYALYWPSIWTLSGALTFNLFQWRRALVEEQKLCRVFPEYDNYRQHCGMLVPQFFTKEEKK